VAGRKIGVRILHILTEGGSTGDGERLALVLGALKRAGHHNALLLQPGASFADTARSLEVPVHELRMRSGAHLGAILRLRRVLKRVPVDLVHLADSRAHHLASKAVLGRPAPAMVVTRRLAALPRGGLLARRRYGKIMRAIVVVSPDAVRALHSMGVAPECIHVIPDGREAGRADAEALESAGLTPQQMADRTVALYEAIGLTGQPAGSAS
jgi:hypothetical protein